jgi:ethanolamine utilization protein EutN
VKLARVVGTVVSTIKSPILEGRAMLVVDLLAPDGRPSGGYLLALDTVGAGAGETVLVLDEGSSARQIVGAPFGPLRTVIVGIVDAVEVSATLTPAATTGERSTRSSARRSARPPRR